MNQEILKKINKGNYKPKARKYINPTLTELLQSLECLEELAGDAIHGQTDVEMEINNSYEMLYLFLIHNSQ